MATIENTCRLCGISANDYSHLNIFSDFGNNINMIDIINEHFKCELNEYDSLPNFVCQICWATTDAFHELYQKSKHVEGKLLNPSVNIEPNFVQVLSPQNEYTQYFEVQSEIELVEKETQTYEDSDADAISMDFDNIEGNISEENVEVIVNTDAENNLNIEITSMKENSQKSDKNRTKLTRSEFEKVFSENRHQFNMTCDHCPIVFDSLDEARGHYANVHNNPLGYIKCCKSKLTYRSQIIYHLARHIDPTDSKHSKVSKDLSLSCDICKKMFASKNGLARHIQMHEVRKHTESDFNEKFIAENFDMKCDFCDVKFVALHDARHHYKNMHGVKRGYIKCCQLKLREKSMVIDHIQSHFKPENYRCEVCDQSFPYTSLKLQHNNRYHSNSKLICDYCGKKFHSKMTILQHLYSKHVDLEAKLDCGICHKKFKLPMLLKSHMYSVHREKKAICTCERCGKSFYTKYHLDKHMISHIERSEPLMEKKQCEHCGEWLFSVSAVFYHQQIHTTGVQKCDQCQMEFRHKPALLDHIRQHHRKQNFKCHHCDRTFGLKSKLKDHEESHTRHKIYTCLFCPKTFTLQTSRQSHIGRHHREEHILRQQMKKQLKISTNCDPQLPLSYHVTTGHE